MVFGRRNKIYIEVDATELTDAQVRLLKSVNAMMEHVLTTDEESEFFEASAEAMRMCASLIKQAHFAHDLEIDGIPYAEQALEYSMDILNEHMTNSKVVQYDN
ncbi:MAG: hypothetical protein CME69_11145 [Halobacteriovorax sp.]|nr:hypothetical protein [Halobacteriovorax sp.]MEE3079342.1 hypothetical protein [Bdellovibrionota bacterium]|tara:strand:- start:129 stop:437 length:309 start_codon:yes stop_codon:yes gene_type:complete